MAKVTFTSALKAEYERLFNLCIILPKNLTFVEKLNQQLIGNTTRYQNVSDQLGIPWFFIAVIHNMEASQNFKAHLHNGEPLDCPYRSSACRTTQKRYATIQLGRKRSRCFGHAGAGCDNRLESGWHVISA